MAHEELPVELFDFLYRDSSRISSYYSQIFQGRLSSLEETDSDKNTLATGGEANVYVVKGKVQESGETQTTSKRTIDPHELITTDVLSNLVESNFIYQNPKSAPHGSLVIEKGTVVFADRHILELTSLAFDAVISEQMDLNEGERDNTVIQAAKLMKAMAEKIQLPSAFFLQTENDLLITGTIKDAGMEEPISTYYFKHGTSGLSDVYVAGIKEVSSKKFSLPATDLIAGSQQMAEAMNNMLFPPDAIKVTPIALFRKLEPVKKTYLGSASRRNK